MRSRSRGFWTRGALPAAAAVLLALAAAAPAAGAEPLPRLSGVLSGQLPAVQGDSAGDPAVLPEDPPPDVPHAPWSDWAEGQQVIYLRRVAIELALGSAQVDGPDLWEEVFSGGAAFSLEAGYCFAPFLSVSALALVGSLSGGSVNDVLVDGIQYDLETRNASFYYMGVDARIRFPLVLLGPALFRFSKAEAGTGLVPFLRLGFGLSHFSSMDVSRLTSSGSYIDSVRLIQSSRAFGYHFGFGVQVRWPWGGLSLELSMVDLGKPALAWAGGTFSGPGGGRIPILHIGVGAGIYF